MSVLNLSSRGEVRLTMRAGVVILVLVTGILLVGCTRLKPSAALVSQGSTNAALVKPNNAKTAKLADLHGMVEVKTGNGQWAQAQSGQTLKSEQQICTGTLSNVSLAFYDGSSMQLGAEAEIALNALEPALLVRASCN